MISCDDGEEDRGKTGITTGFITSAATICGKFNFKESLQ